MKFNWQQGAELVHDGRAVEIKDICETYYAAMPPGAEESDAADNFVATYDFNADDQDADSIESLRCTLRGEIHVRVGTITDGEFRIAEV